MCMCVAGEMDFRLNATYSMVKYDNESKWLHKVMDCILKYVMQKFRLEFKQGTCEKHAETLLSMQNNIFTFLVFA